MCGIVGVYNYKANADDQLPFIEWAQQTMRHRGPDSKGIWNSENYIAGFVRLAIRDLSENGKQPMVSACGNYVLSFNGEIYNADMFQPRLRQAGFSFRSNTDTEVLLYGISHWGIEYVLQQYDGIFAFTFYNKLTNKLLLARDRTGTKPLYVGHSDKGIVYSSQYDHIMNHPYIRHHGLNTGAIGSYLQLGYVPENSGAVQNTFMIPHGYYLEVAAGKFSKHQYFDYPANTTAESNDTLEHVLETSIKQQLVSDVPVGTFMSGGVDSPLVSHYANKHTRLHSFTLGVTDEAMDESKAAAEYATLFGTNHSTLMINERDMLSTIDDNTAAYTEPFADYSSIPTLLLSKFARSKVTVALSGDGGDELFWGYPRNARMLKEGMMFRKSKIERVIAFGAEKFAGGKRTIRRRHLQVKDFPAYYYRSLYVTGAEQWLPSGFANPIETAYFYKRIHQNNSGQLLSEQQMMNVLRKMEMDIHLQRILLKVDRASMFHSLEVRVPLLSNQMLAYSTTQHYTECIQNGIGKINLKNLLASHSNEQLVFQPKKGFTIPIGNWLRNELKVDVQDKLLNMPAELSTLFKKQALEALLKEHNEKKNDLGWLIWSLYALVNWHAAHRNKYKA